jgi:hypothetical protein
VPKQNNVKTVDMEVLAAVYNAASKRLERVRAAEAREWGVARTNLTDIGRAALTGWQPTPAALKNASPRRPDTITTIRREDGSTFARCQLCGDEFSDTARTTLRMHAKTHTRTFRFSMSRNAYDKIRDAIHGANLSVSAVVQDGLERFARTGEF